MRRLSILPLMYAAAGLCRTHTVPLSRPVVGVRVLRRRPPTACAAISETEAPSTQVVVKVSMVDALRRHLRLPKKERKARFFIDPAVDDAGMYEQLASAIRSHWGWLPDDFRLRHAALEERAGEEEAEEEGEHADSLTVSSTAELELALASARARGVAPTFKLSAVLPERRGPPPRVKVDPAELMADNPLARMISFYAFVPIADPAALKAELESRLSAVRVLGSVYVAAEGLNGQLMVRADMLDELRAALRAIEPLRDVELNLGDEVRADEVKPFERFKVTQKGKVLQDGLGTPLDLSSPEARGDEIPAQQWHAELSLPEAERPLLLDCRNWYESEVGAFEGALPLRTDKFHESWPKLEQALEGVDPARRVLTYCTGGIRCVKVNAYLKQRLGLRNVASLEHGIVGYKRWLEQEQSAGAVEPPRSLFRGTNFVFDQRVGVKVTDDRLTSDPVLSLIYEDGDEARELREAVYHETRKHETH